MTFYEAIKKFESKTGETFYWKAREGYKLKIAPDNSFCQWMVDGDILYLGQVFGSYNYWLNFVLEKIKEYHCKYIITWTFRNPKACARQWKAVVIREEFDIASNRKCYTLLAEVDKWATN